ncbi:hypothetical protein V865_001310 [Kwoniella europaea PYCC6329]|uniref:Autophagy-related protein n=1 Tax=Kwoniella europaea PYCC6329 TaxID=1423913 RepID=A0AAX4KBA7_9TREE
MIDTIYELFMSHATSPAPPPSLANQRAASDIDIMADPVEPLSKGRLHSIRSGYRFYFVISTIIEMVVGGVTPYLVVKIEKHHRITYISNLYDLINTYLGLLYQLITLIDEHRAVQSSVTHPRIIIPSLVALLITGLGESVGR